jgi:hypothetical protein
MDKSSPPIPGCNKLEAGSIISMFWVYTIRISGMYSWFNWNMKNPRHGFPHFPPLGTMQQFYCLHWYDWRQSTTSYWPFMHPKGGSLGLGFRQAGQGRKTIQLKLTNCKKSKNHQGSRPGRWCWRNLEGPDTRHHQLRASSYSFLSSSSITNTPPSDLYHLTLKDLNNGIKVHRHKKDLSKQ